MVAVSAVASPPYTRMISARFPPLRKKSRTAKPSLLVVHRPPNVRSNSAHESTSVAVSTGPIGAAPMSAVIDVATPTIVRTPLGTSSM